MRANNLWHTKDLIEDEIIKHIDNVRVIKAPEPVKIHLRVPLIEIIASKATRTGRAVRAWGV